MRSYLVVLLICTVASATEHIKVDEREDIRIDLRESPQHRGIDFRRGYDPRPHHPTHHKDDEWAKRIIEVLNKASEVLQQVDRDVHAIVRSQKGIERQLEKQEQHYFIIGKLESGLVNLQEVLKRDFQTTAKGIQELAAITRLGDQKIDKAVSELHRDTADIKKGLVVVVTNQGKYERDLGEVERSVNQQLKGLELVVKESLRQLSSLDKTGQKLENTQKLIVNKLNYLDELSALADHTNRKVQVVERSVQSLNATVDCRLVTIAEELHKVQQSNRNIDSKLGVLLNGQTKIEKGLEICKKWDPRPHGPYPHGPHPHGPHPHGPRPQPRRLESEDWVADRRVGPKNGERSVATLW